MLLADAEEFWKAPNVFDVMTFGGFALGILSIWLAWWLAKRDIEKRLVEVARDASAAARDEVRRVGRALLHSGIGSTIRSLELCREACNGKRWARAAELCLLAREQLARILAQPAADDKIEEHLRDVSAALQNCVKQLRDQPRVGTGVLPPAVQHGLDEAILALHRVEGRLTGIQMGADHG